MRITGRCLLVALLGLAVFFALRFSRTTPIVPSRIEHASQSANSNFADSSLAKNAAQKELSNSVATNFETWIEHFLSTPAAERANLIEAGKTIGLARRQVMENLIKTDPQAALAQSVSDD